MKLTLVIAALCAFAMHVVNATSISEITLRISQEEQFHNSQMSAAKSEIAENVASARSRLNARCDGLKQLISAGPASCKIWNSQIETIQKTVNAMYNFRSCETGSKLGNVRLTFFELKKSAERAAALCRFNFGTCQSQVSTLERGLDALHGSIENDANNMRSTSRECVAKKENVHAKLLDSAEVYWKECK